MSEQLRLLIMKCIDNDRDAQRKLYYMFYDEMRIFLTKKVDNTDIIIEILNEGFLRVFKKIHLFDFKGSFAGWVKRIMFHALCDYIKRNNDKTLYFPEQMPNNSVEFYDNVDFKTILSYIEELPNKTKSVFNLSLEGYTHVQISKMLNITQGTSKWHLFEARQFLQKKILKDK